MAELIDKKVIFPNGVFALDENNPIASVGELINRIANAPTTTEAEIRAKAIDEFAEKLKWEYENSIGIPQREINFATAVIEQVAEQLKGE